MLDKQIYQHLGDKKIFWINYIKQLFIIWIISLFLPSIISFLSFSNIWYTWIFITFILQCYILIPRINDINKSPTYWILAFLVIYIILWYFKLNDISWILLWLLGLIPSDTNSYFKNYYNTVTKFTSQSPEISTIATTNQTPDKKWDNIQLFKTLLFWISIWLWLSLFIVRIWFYILHTVFWIKLGSIITITGVFISIRYWFNICRKWIQTYSDELQIESKTIISRFFWRGEERKRGEERRGEGGKSGGKSGGRRLGEEEIETHKILSPSSKFLTFLQRCHVLLREVGTCVFNLFFV